MNVEIKVTPEHGKGVESIIKDINMKMKEVESRLATLAEATSIKMRFIIRSQAKHQPTTGNLESHIKTEKIPEGFGVGNIAELDNTAPYWYIVNFGGSVKNFGGDYHFTRGYFVNGGFVYDTTSPIRWKLPSGLTTSAVLPAMNYIQSTVAWLNIIWNQYFAGDRIGTFKTLRLGIKK